MSAGENRIVVRLRDASRGVAARLLPYFTAGFPDAHSSAALIRRADSVGAPVVEIGIPYSDSIADGPVIQGSFYDVLRNGHSLADTFQLISEVRPHVSCGLAAMVSYSIVYRYGVDAFLDRAVATGVDGIILPDVPTEECAEISECAAQAGLCYIGLVSPTTSDDRRTAIAARSTGFLYQIAVSGTTGEREKVAGELPTIVAQLRRTGGLPVCVGFGVSTPGHVREVCRYADGAIVGSAIVHRIQDALAEGMARDQAIDDVGRFVEVLADASREGAPDQAG